MDSKINNPQRSKASEVLSLDHINLLASQGYRGLHEFATTLTQRVRELDSMERNYAILPRQSDEILGNIIESYVHAAVQVNLNRERYDRRLYRDEKGRKYKQYTFDNSFVRVPEFEVLSGEEWHDKFLREAKLLAALNCEPVNNLSMHDALKAARRASGMSDE